MFKIKFIYNFLLYPFILFFLIADLYSKTIKIEGLNRLTLDDLQAMTEHDLFKNNFSNTTINEVIKSFLNSNLFYDIELDIKNDHYVLILTENYIIKNIYINNNIRLDDELLFNALSSKPETFLDNNLVASDISNIKNSYISIGFKDISVSSKIEKLSNTHINLIYEIIENKPFKIRHVDFIGNKHFSDRYLRGIINSKPVKSFNIFTTGSNLNEALISFDLSKLKNLYIDSGFNDVKINYSLSKNKNDYTLEFIVDENDRFTINEIIIENLHDDAEFIKFLEKTKTKIKSDISKKNNFYNKSLLDEYLSKLNKKLQESNFDENVYRYSLSNIDNSKIDLVFYLTKSEKFAINRINISGNTITKDKTIRSRLTLEPGDIVFSRDFIEANKKILNNEKFINSTNIDIINLDNDKVDIDIEISENPKTGNLFIAGGFDQDTGIGFSLGLSDNNILGTGNKIDSSLNLSTDTILFDVGITQKPIHNTNLTLRYNIFNKENDFKDSFGYKSKSFGLGFGISSYLSKNLSNHLSFKLSSNENYDKKNTALSITDNIGKFNKFSINYNLAYNTLNNDIYPSDGSLNSLSFEISPNIFSEVNYYKLSARNNFYFKMKNSESNLFLLSSLDFVDTLDNDRLKTIDSLSLGGRSFKGFDFRGIGPKDDFSNYLGGKKRYILSFGHTSSFLFDKKDNILLSNYFTIGSLWDNDYQSDDHYMRASFTTSFDVLTPIGPLTISYSIPLEKDKNDVTNNVSFSIGTTF